MLSHSYPTELESGLSLEDTRAIVAGEVARSATGAPRAGVLPGSPAVIVTGSTQGMIYQIGQFAAVTSRDGIGAEKVVNRAVATISTTAAPGANSRLDVIWVRCQFEDHGDPGSTPEFGVAQGTAAPIPQKPELPAGALELATAQVTSQDTTTSTVVITQSFPWTAMAGGVVLVRNDVELAAWNAPDGAIAQRLDTGIRYRRAAGQWVVDHREVFEVSPPAVIVGAVPPAGAPVIRQHAVTFQNTNENGDTSWVYPRPFPNGLVSVRFTRRLSGGLGPTVEALLPSQPLGLSRLDWRVFSPGGAPVAGAVAMPYILEAVGW